MKKILVIFMTLICLSCFALCAVGCEGGATTLKYGEKYYPNNGSFDRKADDADQIYYVFNKNGTGVYHYYYRYVSSYEDRTDVYDYTITFSYSFIDSDREGVVCTFDSVKYAERDNQKSVKSNWDAVFSVSENVLMSAGGSLYYSHSYLAAHPDFCKE